MKKRLLLLIFLLTLFTFSLNIATSKAAITKMFVWPSVVTLEDSINFTLEIRVELVWKMNSYQAYLSWDPTLLNATKVRQGPFLSNNSQIPTRFTSKIYNDLGLLQVWESQLVDDTELPNTAMGGNGTLFYVDFVAKSTGYTIIDLYNTKIKYVAGDQSHDAIDGFFNNELYDIRVENDIFTVDVKSNSTVHNFNFDLIEKSITFNVSGVDGSVGWLNVTIPKGLLSAPPPDQWTVLIDNEQVPYILTENASHTFIYLTYIHSTHYVLIRGTQVVPEHGLLSALLLLSTVALLYLKRIRIRKTFRSF